MKKRILIGAAVVAVLAGALLVTHNRNAPFRVYHQGRSVSTWTSEFYPNFQPQNTNEAVMAFQAMGVKAVPALRMMLQTKETWYARSLARHGRILPSSVRGYLWRKTKPGEAVSKRLAAARALGVVGTNAVAAVPDLIQALADADARWAAAQALASIGGPAIPALAFATTNPDANVRHAAVYGLGVAGTNAASATAALLDCLRDPNQSVQSSAAYSLGQVGRPGLPVVLESFSSDDMERRRSGVAALKAMNTPPRQIVISLLEFTTNASPRLRQNSLIALQSLRLNHPRVVANYFRATTDPDSGVRATGARGLAQVETWKTNAAFGSVVVHLLGGSGDLQSNAVVTLTGLLSDSELAVRDAARESLASLQASSAN